MNVLEYLDRVGERRLERAKGRTPMLPRDFQGWLGLGLFLQSTMLFGLIAAVPDLRESQGFLTLASAVIVTGWIGGAAAFAYAAGKRDAEQQEQTRQALASTGDAIALAGAALATTGASQPDVAAAAEQVADAAADEASRIKEEGTSQ